MNKITKDKTTEHTKPTVTSSAVEKSQLLVPQLRFSEFENKWSFDKLKNITSYVDYRGRGPIKSDEGVFLVTAKNIKKGYIDYENSQEYVPIENYDIVMSKGKPKEGDVLFTTEAPLGNVAQVDNTNIALAQRVIKFRGTNELNNRYLLYYMLSATYQRLISRKAIGSTVQGISGKELHKTKINFPSLPEQQKIAQFLTAVDSKLQQLNQKKELLAQYKKGVMQQLFSQQLRFEQEDGSDYPDWEEKKLGEIADRVSTKNTSNEVNFVLTNSATQGVVSQQEYFDKEIANQNNLEGYYIVSKDDFVYNPRISASAPVGPIKRNKLQKGVMSPLYSIFRFKESLLEYFEHYFETTSWHKYLHSVANFGARHDRMNITNSDFFKMPIPMPTYDERKKIANYLSAIDSKIETVTQQIEATQQFKKGLLQQMFV